MLALRFNRTLLIQSSNGYDELFRPYRSPSKVSAEMTYKDCLRNSSWSKYDQTLADNDKTELDLYFCINRNDMDAVCGMESGDVKQPIIKLRGNRGHFLFSHSPRAPLTYPHVAYICKWATHPNMAAYHELRALGINENTDLLEAGGCLLRLAMWPTEKLFKAAEKLSLTRAAATVGSDIAALQVGIHYRCGDVSFVHPNDLKVTGYLFFKEKISLKTSFNREFYVGLPA